MRVKYGIWIGVILLAIVCAVAFIFGNSLQDAEESIEHSDVFVELFRPILDPRGEQEEEVLSFVVRKLAHLTEFFLLGVLVCLFLLVRRPKPLGRAALVGLLICLAIAATDEIIQCFFDRTPQVADVLLDFSGSAVGIALALAVHALVARS